MLAVLHVPEGELRLPGELARERGDDRNVVVGGGPDSEMRTSAASGFVSMPTVTYVEYVCPVCGSVEWFRRNHLEHPPPGG